MARNTVEDYLCLDMAHFARQGPTWPLLEGSYDFEHHGTWVDSISWEWTVDGVGFHCSWVRSDKVRMPYTYRVRMSHTPTQFGGTRAWFHCPTCDKRVQKLFTRWADDLHLNCRTCHDLTYTSQQRQDTSFLRAMDRALFDPNPEHVGSAGWLAALREKAEILNASAVAKGRPPQDFAAMLGSGELFTSRPPGRPKEKRPYHRRSPFAQGE